MSKTILSLLLFASLSSGSFSKVVENETKYIDEEYKICKSEKNFYLIEIKLANIKSESIKPSEVPVIKYQLSINDINISKIKYQQNNSWHKRRFSIAKTNLDYKDLSIYEYESFIVDKNLINKDELNKISIKVHSGLGNKDHINNPIIANTLIYNRTIHISDNKPSKRKLKNDKWMGLLTISYIDTVKNKEYMKRCNFLSKNNLDVSQFILSKRVKDSFRESSKQSKHSVNKNKTTVIED